MTQIDPETARLLFSAWRTWFGSPLIRHRHETIDGRIRACAAANIGITIPKTSIIVTTIDSEAAKHLVLAGHFDRALRYIPEALHDADAASIFCGLSRELVAPLFLRRRRNCTRMQRHTTPRRRQAIERIAALLREAREGVGYVTADRIAEVLEPWL